MRAVTLLVLDLLWGLAFFRVGPRQALVSLYYRDAHHRMHPRAALSGLWWTWRLSTISCARDPSHSRRILFLSHRSFRR